MYNESHSYMRGRFILYNGRRTFFHFFLLFGCCIFRVLYYPSPSFLFLSHFLGWISCVIFLFQASLFLSSAFPTQQLSPFFFLICVSNAVSLQIFDSTTAISATAATITTITTIQTTRPSTTGTNSVPPLPLPHEGTRHTTHIRHSDTIHPPLSHTLLTLFFRVSASNEYLRDHDR